MRQIPERVDTTFRFVLLVAHRAEQLMRGALPKLEADDRVTRLALRELDESAVEWEYGPAPVPEQVLSEEGEASAEAEAQ